MKIAVGIGCDRDTPLVSVRCALHEALEKCQAELADVAAIASIDLKADEGALLQLAEQEGEDDGIDTGEHYHVLSQDALWDAFGEERALAWRWMRLAMDVLDTESNSAD